MPKHLIIDGYNLLGVSDRRSPRSGQAGELSRERLIQDLVLYRQRVGHAITVVFDAWRQQGGTQHHEHRSGVTVMFTRQGEQADQVIQQMARMQNEDCVVISSDHEIINTAKAQGAMVLRSQEFLPKLRQRSSSLPSRQAIKPIEDDDSTARRRPDKKGNPRRLSKAERQRLRKLKKL